MEPKVKFRDLLSEGQLFAPCVYDCLSARAADLCRYQALMLSGGAVAYSMDGLPDMAFSTIDEVAWITERITNVNPWPLIFDADDGFGESPVVVYHNMYRLVKAGARVRVKLNMVATSRRYHVALVDPLPAGFEALNPALAVTGTVPQDPATNIGYWWWWRTWYEHQNLRDERAEAFTSLLWEGVYDYTYVARATTPGSFVVPPTKAEEMYAPETFGRSATDRVVVE